MKKTIIASAIMMMSASVFANSNADSVHGKINFVGTIIDSPCSIAPESMDQTIQMGNISADSLKSNTAETREFRISLESCSTQTASQAAITFDGVRDGRLSDLLALEGSVAGAGLSILDSSGNAIKLGSKFPVKIGDNYNTILFGAKLLTNGLPIEAGQFTSVANFTVTYA